MPCAQAATASTVTCTVNPILHAKKEFGGHTDTPITNDPMDGEGMLTIIAAFQWFKYHRCKRAEVPLSREGRLDLCHAGLRLALLHAKSDPSCSLLLGACSGC